MVEAVPGRGAVECPDPLRSVVSISGSGHQDASESAPCGDPTLAVPWAGLAWVPGVAGGATGRQIGSAS